MFDYIIQPGDTIYSITRLFGITTAQLLSVNPTLDGENLVVGQKLRIPEYRDVRPTIEVNGYAYLTVSQAVLENALPYLTFLSILGYDVRPDGTFPTVDDTRLIEAARQQGVASLMVVSNIEPDIGFSADLAHTLLSDLSVMQTMINYIIATLKAKNYYGVNINFSELYPSDYIAYAAFLQSLTTQLRPLGYLVVIAARMTILIEQQALLTSINQRFSFNGIMDRLIIRSNDWACTYRRRETSYIDELQQAIDFATQHVSSPKILITIPNCCYSFKLTGQGPHLYRLLTPAQADELVQQTGGVFRIDPRSRTSHFTYVDSDGVVHEVLCEIDTNLRAPLALVQTYNLGGVSFRTIESFSTASYQTVSAMFEIRKFITV